MGYVGCARKCARITTHPHPPTHTAWAERAPRCCSSNSSPLLPRLSLFTPSSLCVNGKQKRKRDCDTARLSWPRDDWHHSAPAFRHAWLLHEAELAVNSPSDSPRPRPPLTKTALDLNCWTFISLQTNINTLLHLSFFSFFLSFFFWGGWCGTARVCGCGRGRAWVLGGVAWLGGLDAGGFPFFDPFLIAN